MSSRVLLFKLLLQSVPHRFGVVHGGVQEGLNGWTDVVVDESGSMQLANLVCPPFVCISSCCWCWQLSSNNEPCYSALHKTSLHVELPCLVVRFSKEGNFSLISSVGRSNFDGHDDTEGNEGDDNKM